ncbi:GNAT family N-acetyltransferase [Ohtaekwangia sp.]|uniref:GNAT family N-acetyltransferase n=1 Tax=Ohtaekwangia sp. TaxID=2066019 RepID=UPI002F9217BE
MSDLQFKAAATAADFEQGRRLFEEYAGSLDFDLGFQDFKKELDTISHQYQKPKGTLLLCFHNETAIGCVGIRALSENTAELKRLYVRPAYRNLKIGKQLLERAIDTAKELRYAYIRLDTVPSQAKAQELYRLLGFYNIAPYRHNPIAGTIYMERKLD